ncbi:MAG: AIR carboxylase family protein [Armatimonadetes bacterium]|nr:AIR carboxylase family protein [Armatimonadota bacterium]
MSPNARVGIVTCYEGDFAHMSPAIDLLDKFEVSFEIVAIDPIGVPERATQYAESARERGLKFILAGTGDAPNLPLILASHTTLPVLGVPLPCHFIESGNPSYSMVPSSSRAPVASVSSGDAHSAALVALRALAIEDEELSAKLDELHD